MPSYRVAVDVHAVAPGVAPPDLLPRAEELLATGHRVEDRSVELVRGQPQIHLRFLVPGSHDVAEDDEAEAAVRALLRDLSPIADLGHWVLRRGAGGRWRTVRTGDAREDAREHPVDF